MAATEITAAPLLMSSSDSSSGGGDRTTTIRDTLLGLFAGRRGASMIVRQTAANHLDSWREDWGYSLPVVALDMLWNLSFVVLSVVMLFWTAREKPNVPLRVWICGYALQCAIHMVLVLLQYRRRNRRVVYDERGYLVDYSILSDATRLENYNTKISYMWWVLGCYWLLSAYKILLHSAPHLFWLALAFLALDVFLAVISFAMACLLGLAVCFCLPCIIAFLCIFAGQAGASEADISVLPKYRFAVSSTDEEQPDVGAGRMVPFETNGQDFSAERVLPTEDAECCICLCSYEDGEELHSLPCTHHFHATCIVKWLKMKAICPLCKNHIHPIDQV